MGNLRKVVILRRDEEFEAKFSEVRAKDVFRIIEVDGMPYPPGQGAHVWWRASRNAYPDPAAPNQYILEARRLGRRQKAKVES